MQLSVSDHRLFAFFDNEELSGAFPSGRLDCIAQFSKRYKKKKGWNTVAERANAEAQSSRRGLVVFNERPIVTYEAQKTFDIVVRADIKSLFSSSCYFQTSCFFLTDELWLICNIIFGVDRKMLWVGSAAKSTGDFFSVFPGIPVRCVISKLDLDGVFFILCSLDN